MQPTGLAYEYLFRNNPIPMWIFNPETLKFYDVNEACLQQYGYTREDFARLNLRDMRPAEDLPRFDQAFSKPFPEPAAGATHWRHLTQDGRVLDISVTGSEATYQGRPARVAALNDVTQQRVMLDWLKEELVQATQLSDFRSQMTSMVAHELKSPLSAIKVYRDAIARHSAVKGETILERALDRIDMQVRSMNDMVSDLLLLNQYYVGKLELETIRFDLNDLCAHVVDHWRTVAEERNIILFQRPGKSVSMHGDLKLLNRVIDNLLSNAVKYSRKGGTILVTLSTSEDQAIIRVRDQGIGIPQAARKQIFEMFQRADNARHLAGTGLGLAFCRMAVDLHGGRIGFESEEGSGTTFIVQLPLNSRTV
jgi:PAS domain S-box-containing protein